MPLDCKPAVECGDNKDLLNLYLRFGTDKEIHATTPSPPCSELPGGHVETVPQTGPLPKDTVPDQMPGALLRMTSDSAM